MRHYMKNRLAPSGFDRSVPGKDRDRITSWIRRLNFRPIIDEAGNEDLSDPNYWTFGRGGSQHTPCGVFGVQQLMPSHRARTSRATP
jgi:hypothetical protein